MPDKPTSNGKLGPIPLPSTNASLELREAITVFNAFQADPDLASNFPDDLSSAAIQGASPT